ncbi:MAG TPA: hypothetical protein VN207_03125 [Ktedonobacteraceae bacterium]|nr:hypothetical protein [Ktedonobacteraceae bacterium]
MHGEIPEAIFDDLINLLQSAEAYSDQSSYQQALDVYVQVIDAHLAAHEASLISLFDRAIAEFLPRLDLLLAEASSLIISEPSQPSDLSEVPDLPTSAASPTLVPVTMSPLLTPEVRRSWLERLFALWLKCIDIRQISEQVQEIMFEVAWSEDIPFLRNLVESELRHISADTHLHVGDFAKQSRTPTLEKFLKELPQ